MGVSLPIGAISLGMAVPAPVDFQNEPRFGAIEINGIDPQGMLTPEFVGGESPATKDTPQFPFGGGGPPS
jgi:hypothetical protein